MESSWTGLRAASTDGNDDRGHFCPSGIRDHCGGVLFKMGAPGLTVIVMMTMMTTTVRDMFVYLWCRLRMDSGANLAPFWRGLGRLEASWGVLGAS